MRIALMVTAAALIVTAACETASRSPTSGVISIAACRVAPGASTTRMEAL